MSNIKKLELKSTEEEGTEAVYVDLYEVEYIQTSRDRLKNIIAWDIGIHLRSGQCIYLTFDSESERKAALDDLVADWKYYSTLKKISSV